MRLSGCELGISGVRSDSLSTVPQPLPRLRASLSGLNSVSVALHSIRQPYIFFSDLVAVDAAGWVAAAVGVVVAVAAAVDALAAVLSSS